MNLKEWAEAIRQRDGECMRCGLKHSLNAHHIKPVKTHPDLAYSLANGITLCRWCHRKQHEIDRKPRPPRPSVKNPRPKTLQRVIEQLTADLAAARTEIEYLKGNITRPQKQRQQADTYKALGPHRRLRLK